MRLPFAMNSSTYLMTYLMFFCALALSTVAEFYSVIGLMSIFPGAKSGAIVIGVVLGASKLVVASWLYHNWKDAPTLMKSYMTVAVLVLMFLTSMSVFGYLSKASNDQMVASGEIGAKVQFVEEKIAAEKDKIDSAKMILSQLDSQVNEMIGRSTSTQAVNRSITIRRQQDKERNQLLTEIESAQVKIGQLQEELLPLKSENRQLEAEVGPIKYIAAIIYGDNVSTNLLEQAVRWVISLIVSVFDPLAVVMLIAANWSLKRLSNIPNMSSTRSAREARLESSSSSSSSSSSNFTSLDNTESIKESLEDNLEDHQIESSMFQPQKDIIPHQEQQQRSNMHNASTANLKQDVTAEDDMDEDADGFIQEMTQAEIDHEIAEMASLPKMAKSTGALPASPAEIDITATPIKPILEMVAETPNESVRNWPTKGLTSNISGADESETTLQNALDDTGQFWRSRPMKPINGGNHDNRVTPDESSTTK